MNNDCERCGGKCCIGTIDVYSTDEIFYDEALVREDPDMKYDRVMRTNDNLVCIALKDGKCNIYDKRPQVCRQFEVGCQCCLDFQSGHLNGHKCKLCYISETLEKAQKKYVK